MIDLEITLTYTQEMLDLDENDNLTDEDFKLLKQSFETIMKEAESYGIDYVYRIYEAHNEVIIDLFNSKDELERASLGNFDDYESFGYCSSLIYFLENKLN